MPLADAAPATVLCAPVPEQCMFATFPVFQPPMVWLKAEAEKNVARSVKEVVPMPASSRPSADAGRDNRPLLTEALAILASERGGRWRPHESAAIAVDARRRQVLARKLVEECYSRLAGKQRDSAVVVAEAGRHGSSRMGRLEAGARAVDGVCLSDVQLGFVGTRLSQTVEHPVLDSRVPAAKPSASDQKVVAASNSDWEMPRPRHQPSPQPPPPPPPPPPPQQQQEKILLRPPSRSSDSQLGFVGTTHWYAQTAECSVLDSYVPAAQSELSARKMPAPNGHRPYAKLPAASVQAYATRVNGKLGENRSMLLSDSFEKKVDAALLQIRLEKWILEHEIPRKDASKLPLAETARN